MQLRSGVHQFRTQILSSIKYGKRTGRSQTGGSRGFLQIILLSLVHVTPLGSSFVARIVAAHFDMIWLAQVLGAEVSPTLGKRLLKTLQTCSARLS